MDDDTANAFRRYLERVDDQVERITDEEIEARVRQLLIDNGYAPEDPITGEKPE